MDNMYKDRTDEFTRKFNEILKTLDRLNNEPRDTGRLIQRVGLKLII